MTDNEIKDLARKYAKIAAFDGGFVNPDDFETEYQNALPVIQWLVESHCIVSREKIQSLYKKMEVDGCHVDTDNDWAISEAMDKLEEIFGTDLFQEGGLTILADSLSKEYIIKINKGE